MHKAYLGQHQFSIEGVDVTVPMLDGMIALAAADGAEEVVIGMAHRGRLNVLAHGLGRAYESIFAEFEGATMLDAITTNKPQGGTGDLRIPPRPPGRRSVWSGPAPSASTWSRIHRTSNTSHGS